MENSRSDVSIIPPNISLCKTCENSGGCDFEPTNNRPVLQCEMFSCCQFAGRNSLSLLGPNDNGDEDSSKPTTICNDCKNHKSCSLSLMDGDKWYCEEFVLEKQVSH